MAADCGGSGSSGRAIIGDPRTRYISIFIWLGNGFRSKRSGCNDGVGVDRVNVVLPDVG